MIIVRHWTLLGHESILAAREFKPMASRLSVLGVSEHGEGSFSNW
jgi:hypothetical protein